jgi:Peptidase A4 family
MPRIIQAVVVGLSALLAALPVLPSPAQAGPLHRSGDQVSSAPRTPVHHAHRAAAGGWMSSNWSGYAALSGTYSEVSATWVVPAVSPTPSPTFSAIWIGIGGFSDSGLIQVGTEQDYTGSGRYYAWWEVLPSAEARIDSVAVRPGDHIAGSISRRSGTTWTIAFQNQTSGQSFSTSKVYAGSQRSAEWILEAPDIGKNAANLAHYGRTTFNPVTANATSPGLIPSDAGVMVQHGRQVSTPSDPTLGGGGFSIAYGPDRPPPPSFY